MNAILMRTLGAVAASTITLGMASLLTAGMADVHERAVLENQRASVAVGESRHPAGRILVTARSMSTPQSAVCPALHNEQSTIC